MDFLNAEGGNGGSDSGSGSGGDSGSSSSSSSSQGGSGSGAPQTMSSDGSSTTTTDVMSEYNSLQYHFFCGYNFAEADKCTSKFCPTGDKGECPDGMQCYASTKCDGRDTPAPSTSSALVPSPSPNEFGSGSNIQCTLCGRQGLSEELPVMFQGNPSTCGELNVMVGQFNPDACMTVREMYQETCCYDGCQLCQTMEGDFLDLRKDHVVKKGEYTATCDEIQNLLTTFATSEEICAKSQSELAEECCYDQCSLCEDNESTKWNSIVQFGNVTTTCLGLDYLLRTEQISSKSERCTDLQEEYESQCCRVGSKPDTCQLCKAENGDTYGVKNATLAQLGIGDSTITCEAVASAMVVMESADAQCISAKEKYFDPCCNLTDAQHIVHNAAGAPSSSNSTSDDGSNSTTDDNNATVDATKGDGYWSSDPMDGFNWNKRPSAAGFVSFTKATLGALTVVCGCLIM